MNISNTLLKISPKGIKVKINNVKNVEKAWFKVAKEPVDSKFFFLKKI